MLTIVQVANRVCEWMVFVVSVQQPADMKTKNNQNNKKKNSFQIKFEYQRQRVTWAESVSTDLSNQNVHLAEEKWFQIDEKGYNGKCFEMESETNVDNNTNISRPARKTQNITQTKILDVLNYAYR